jgi:hypothetical protein
MFRKTQTRMKTMNKNSLKPLALTFAAGGIWDTVAGCLYLFAIGTGRVIDNPPIDPFYAIFLGSFFFCFAYLQILSSLNIERYAIVVGCLFFGRLFYIVVLYSFMLFVGSFPATFWFTGIIDAVFATLYLLFAHTGGLSWKQLVLPGYTGEIEKQSN